MQQQQQFSSKSKDGDEKRRLELLERLKSLEYKVTQLHHVHNDDQNGRHRHSCVGLCRIPTHQVFKKGSERDPEFNSILESPSFQVASLVRYNARRKDICSILSSSLAPGSDFLLRTDTGDQVSISSLKGKKVGLYFSSSISIDHECDDFERILVDVYDELKGKGDFEVIVSPCCIDESLSSHICKMPWLAVPFSDSNALSHLDKLFIAYNRPVFVIIDEHGEVLTDRGVELIEKHGAEGYPFTPNWIKELNLRDEATKINQSLPSVLASNSPGFLSSFGLKDVTIDELEGNYIGLYFSEPSSPCSSDFTAKLRDVYEVLKVENQRFEIVTIPLEDEEEPFRRELEAVPWLSLPFKDKRRWRLHRYFEVSAIPTLVVIGPNGKTIHLNAVDAVKDYGALAFPFTAERFSELKMREKAKHESQTLETLIVSGDLDFVISKDGSKVLVSSLAGKHVLLYFSSESCHYLTEDLAKTFESIKKVDDAFEVISVFHHADKRSFDKHFSKISSWLALPFGDERKQSLCCSFKGTPLLVAYGPSGRFITTEALEFLELYGAEAYPFTEKHMEEVEKRFVEASKKWPEKVKHPYHEHELVRSPAPEYICEGCERKGKECAFKCKKCSYFRHPECALECEEGLDELGSY